MTTSAASAPNASAARVRLIASLVEFEPVPAITGTRLPVASTHKRMTRSCSSWDSVADSPVEPLGTSPFEPCLICQSTKRWNAASSILPFAKGVMRAVMDPENMQNLRRACAHLVSTLVGGARPGKARLLHGAACVVAGLALLAPVPAGAFTAGETSAARAAIADVDHGKWDAAYQAADQAHFPLLTKLITWLDMTRPGTGADFEHLRAFVQENPDWPQQTLLRRHAEDAMTDSTPPAGIVTWFQQSGPVGPTGAGRLVDALNATNQHAQAEATARQFLVEGTMNPSEVTEFAGRYQPMLRQVDFELRA